MLVSKKFLRARQKIIKSRQKQQEHQQEKQENIQYKFYSIHEWRKLLSNFTVTHEINKDLFTCDDLKEAWKYHQKYSESLTCSTLCCRLRVFKNSKCYLCGIIAKKRS
jgi:hypothetical protein